MFLSNFEKRAMANRFWALKNDENGQNLRKICKGKGYALLTFFG